MRKCHAPRFEDGLASETRCGRGLGITIAPQHSWGVTTPLAGASSHLVWSTREAEVTCATCKRLLGRGDPPS